MKKIKKLIGLFFLFAISIYSCNTNKGKNPNTIIPSATKTSISIENIIKIPTDFTKEYKIIKEEDLSYKDIIRKQLRVTVPAGMDKLKIENNIKHLIIEYYNTKKPDGISISMYENGDNIEMAYTVAMGEFAPNGDWEKVNKNISLEQFQLRIEYKESYFQPKKATINIGSKVTISKKEEWNIKERKFVPASSVPLSNSAREWTSENIIVRIPNNSKAEITDIHKEKLSNGSEFVRYKIRTTYKGKAYQGWINSDEIEK